MILHPEGPFRTILTTYLTNYLPSYLPTQSVSIPYAAQAQQHRWVFQYLLSGDPQWMISFRRKRQWSQWRSGEVLLGDVFWCYEGFLDIVGGLLCFGTSFRMTGFDFDWLPEIQRNVLPTGMVQVYKTVNPMYNLQKVLKFWQDGY